MTKPVTNPSRYPTIRLGEYDWPVAPTTLGQNKLLQPIFADLGKRIMRDGVSLLDLSQDDLTELSRAMVIALRQEHPSLTEDELDTLPIGAQQLVNALLVVMGQSGLYKKEASEPGEVQEGESPSTGTP